KDVTKWRPRHSFGVQCEIKPSRNQHRRSPSGEPLPGQISSHRRMKMRLTLKTAVAAVALSLCTAAFAQAPSDPQIVGIVVAANQIDMDYAKIALAKSKNKEVREFAQQMMTDHTAVQKSVFDLGAKLKVKPAV